jgi:hypothetical protein
MSKWLLPSAFVLALTAIPGPRVEAQSEVESLIARVGERIAAFYKRAANVICIETSTVVPIDASNSSDGFARTVESELRIEEDDRGLAAILRRVLKVNGRLPSERDKKARSGCTDPNPLSAEPLEFLLPAQRSKYQFRTAGTAKDRNRTVLMIDFTSNDRRSRPELIVDPGGHDDCFDWSGHIASRGRIWIDVSTYDVIRVDKGLPGPVDVRVPVPIQSRHQLPNWVSIIRDDVTIRYQNVAFSDPDEVLLLPESIDSFTVLRGGLQSTRRFQRFFDYRRFVTGGRVIP